MKKEKVIVYHNLVKNVDWYYKFTNNSINKIADHFGVSASKVSNIVDKKHPKFYTEYLKELVKKNTTEVSSSTNATVDHCRKIVKRINQLRKKVKFNELPIPVTRTLVMIEAVADEIERLNFNGEYIPSYTLREAVEQWGCTEGDVDLIDDGLGGRILRNNNTMDVLRFKNY